MQVPGERDSVSWVKVAGMLSVPARPGRLNHRVPTECERILTQQVPTSFKFSHSHPKASSCWERS